MATEERDQTADWIVPAERRPPSAFDLQRQIDVAMGVARAAEEAAMEIGQASLEAAEQARIAAVHAERSAEASVALARAGASGQAEAAPVEPPPADVAPDPEPAPALDDPDPAPGHEVIPGSELPAGWSPVAPPAAAPAPIAEPPVEPAPAPIAETFAPAPNGSDPARPARPTAQPDPFDERMIAFRDRAERVMVRLRRLDAAPPVS
jgi:hypothetical protein